MIYNKEVQTTFVETEPTPDYEEIRQRIMRERDEVDKIQRDKELEEESVKLDQEIEQEIRGLSAPVYLEAHCSIRAELSEEERAGILAAPEFLEFVEQSSKIVQRALNDGYDYARDYRIGTQSGGYVVVVEIKLPALIHLSIVMTPKENE